MGQSQKTILEYDVKTYCKRFESFGWNAIPIDGHNIDYSFDMNLIQRILDILEYFLKQKLNIFF